MSGGRSPPQNLVLLAGSHEAVAAELERECFAGESPAPEACERALFFCGYESACARKLLQHPQTQAATIDALANEALAKVGVPYQGPPRLLASLAAPLLGTVYGLRIASIASWVDFTEPAPPVVPEPQDWLCATLAALFAHRFERLSQLLAAAPWPADAATVAVSQLLTPAILNQIAPANPFALDLLLRKRLRGVPAPACCVICSCAMARALRPNGRPGRGNVCVSEPVWRAFARDRECLASAVIKC